MTTTEIKGRDEEEAMMSKPDTEKPVLRKRQGETEYFGKKTKISICLLTVIFIVMGGALLLGFPRKSSLPSPAETLEEGVEEEFIAEDEEESFVPKNPEVLGKEHEIIKKKISAFHKSFSDRFPRDNYGNPGDDYRMPLDEVPGAYLRTLAYASRDSESKKVSDVFYHLDSNRDSEADPWELHDWIVVVQKLVDDFDHNTQWKQYRKDVNDTIAWSNYMAQINPSGSSDPKILHRVNRDHRRWKNADQNGDDHLNKAEFRVFLFPYTVDEVALNIIIPETMDNLDINFDGTVSKDEFLRIHNPSEVEKMSKYFSEILDTNKDGYVNSYEIAPWVKPDGFVAIKSEVINLMSVLDADRNKRLSEEELLRNPNYFLDSQVTSFRKIYTLDL